MKKAAIVHTFHHAKKGPWNVNMWSNLAVLGRRGGRVGTDIVHVLTGHKVWTRRGGMVKVKTLPGTLPPSLFGRVLNILYQGKLSLKFKSLTLG